MALVDEVSAAIADAMRKQDAARLSALRMLKAALQRVCGRSETQEEQR